MTGTRDNPLLMMLSHCVPDPLGDAERARAWQLLRLARQSHRVLLLCAIDGPVGLRQWRAVHHLSEQLAIEPAPLAWRLAGKPAPAWDQAGSALPRRTSLVRRIHSWLADYSFDAVLCTHPTLWPDALAVPAAQRLCDLHRPESLRHRRLAELTRGPLSLWHRWQARQHDQVERLVAQQCDTLTIADEQALHHGVGLSRRNVLVPDAIDIDWYQTAGRPAPLTGAPPPLPLRLVVHAGTARRRHDLDWFTNEVWPRVREAVPQAQVAVTDAAPDADPLRELRAASVVVSPQPEPDQARWPILQALALQRPVVACEQAVSGLGIRDGEHVLLTHRQGDWTDHCVQLLRSARERLALARRGRWFVERHFPIDRTGQQLAATLRHEALPSGLSLATAA